MKWTDFITKATGVAAEDLGKVFDWGDCGKYAQALGAKNKDVCNSQCI